MKIAHVETSNVVPSLMTYQLYENMPKKVVGKPLKGVLLENLPGEKNNRLQKLFESLNLEGIESWRNRSKSQLKTL